jgi:hypothetical protein
MKNNPIKVFIKIPLLIISLGFSFCNLSGHKKKEKELFLKVKNGMNKNEVIKILGQPDTVSYDIVDSSFYTLYFFTEDKFGVSTLPQVTFDSTNTVSFVTYGDPG